MKNFFVSLKLILAFTVILGLGYPAFIWSVGHIFHSHQAEGSLLIENGTVKGSSLIAQKFLQPRYFWPRPSAPNYNALPSGGSNLFWGSSTLADGVETRARYLRAAHKLQDDASIPPELLFASASGLDPHISLEAALFQAKRVAKARGLDGSQHAVMNNLILSHIEPRTFGFLGQERINVLLLNLGLDRQFP